MSALSFQEQGYDRGRRREPAGANAGAAGLAPAGEAERRAYEARFGFRYCVFVAGRPRAALLTGFEAALSADRASEIARALEAAIDIAEDRWATLGGG